MIKVVLIVWKSLEAANEKITYSEFLEVSLVGEDVGNVKDGQKPLAHSRDHVQSVSLEEFFLEIP